MLQGTSTQLFLGWAVGEEECAFSGRYHELRGHRVLGDVGVCRGNTDESECWDFSGEGRQTQTQPLVILCGKWGKSRWQEAASPLSKGAYE